MVNYGYHSLEDFLVSKHLTIDAVLNDGAGALMPVKGRELDATVLFADMTSFSSRTLDMSPAETLIFVQWFFAWIGAEALKGGKGIIDKYIGDEVMIVFSKEFGSEDPFLDAVQTARWMADHDPWSFCPHVGIASGQVIAGYVGTPLKYNCSVFGAPVALAARCAGVNPPEDVACSSYMTFPAAEWSNRDFDDVFPPRKLRNPDGSTVEMPHTWEMLEPRDVDLKNMPSTPIQQVVKTSFNLPMQTVEDTTREVLGDIRASGRYWPGIG